MPDFNICPDNLEETAEGYLVRSFPLRESQAFEEHYYTCPQCAAVVEKVQRSLMPIPKGL
jgi:hypothetical protein